MATFRLKNIDFSAIPENHSIFIVEGSSEEGFVESVLKTNGLSNNTILNIEGEKNLALVLKSMGGHSIVQRSLSIGLVFDANSDCESRKTAIVTKLEAEGFEFNISSVDSRGVYAGSKFQIGIFLSPGRDRAGRIEHMVLGEIRTAKENRCLDSLGDCLFPHIGNLDEKAIVQIYISARGDPVGLGTAFKRGVFDLNHSTYDSAREMVLAIAR